MVSHWDINWGDHLSVWDEDSRERIAFLANCSLKPTSENSDILRDGIEGQQDRNMSTYISLVPYTSESGKRTFSQNTASTELLAVAPMVPISPGDFLGIFPGRLWHTNRWSIRAISVLVVNLWLEYSEVMGKLTRIKGAKDDEVANVCLAWEGVNVVKGDKSFRQYLRVLGIATRLIMPSDQLIRPPSTAAVLKAGGRISYDEPDKPDKPGRNSIVY